MEPPIPERRVDEHAAEVSESDRRKLGDSEASFDAEMPTTVQSIEELPTEPRHAIPSRPDADWEAPTVPDGHTLEAWDIDERG